MDERRQLTPPERRRESSPARALSDQREQVKRFVAELTETADAAEQEISTSLDRLLEDLAAEQNALQEKHDAAHSARWHDKSRQLEQRERECTAREETLRRRDAELAEAAQRLEEDRRRLAAETEETTRARQRIEERRRKLEEQEEELDALRQETKNQRRRLAAELREQREAVQSERREAADDLERREADLHRREEECRRRSEESAQHAGDGGSAGTDAALYDQIRILETALDERNAALTELTDRCDDLRIRLGDYKAKLAETEARLAEAERGGRSGGDAAEWRRRYEEACEELRELKQHGGAAAQPAEASGSDWESQKRRMLAALESEFDDHDPDAHADRLTIEGTIRITDGVVAEKEQEIADLRRQLAERGNFASVDELAAAQDEYLVERRREIDLLKKEWEQKVREAEVEMSLERAKLARERTEIEDRRADYERLQARAPQEPTVVKTTTEPKRGGGRWLERLGLREKDES